MKKIVSLSILFLFAIIIANSDKIQNLNDYNSFRYEQYDQNLVFKKILKNGLTVLVKPTKNITDIAIEMWYNVGSKDEQDDEKGLAHLLEHTVFKGTKNLLSETDIFAVAKKLSGDVNACTYYDWTKYTFHLPKRHWIEALPIFADCMCNCTFKQDLLNSEFKAVIQELKMYNDNYERTLVSEMISTIFKDHPYHYPVIGFKQHIFNITPEKLYKFYKKHYIPNNATLVVVGDIDPNDVFYQAEKYFCNIKPDLSYKKQEFHFNKDINAKSVTLYRNITVPKVFLAFVIPGLKKQNTAAFDVISALLFNGASSRLYQKLLEDLELVHSIGSYALNLFDHDIFFIQFEPKDISNTEKIISMINEEIKNIINQGIKEKELQKIINTAKMYYHNLMSSNSSQADIIGSKFLISKNENAIFDYFNQDLQKLVIEIKKILSSYFRPAVMHKGYLLPISEEEKQNWIDLQEKSDQEDTEALNNRIRTSDVEPCKYANSIQPKPTSSFDFPQPQIYQMKNGMKVVYYNNPTASIISLNMSFKAHYDYENIEGLYSFMSQVLINGTKKFNSKQISEELSLTGAYLYSSPSNIYLRSLSDEIEKNLIILNDILNNATFEETEIEKTRDSMLIELKKNWDNPRNIANDIVAKTIYKNHPYSRNYQGTKESIEKISRDDLIKFYKKYITPKGTILFISGDLSKFNLPALLEKTLGNWEGPDVEDFEYPALNKTTPQEINYQINRDQTILLYAGMSVDRKNVDFDKLALFDFILPNKLFNLREKTGLFYTISGSLTSSSGLQPGIVSISTIVSNDKLIESEKLIENFIDNGIDSVTEEDLKEAKDSLIDNWVNFYSTNDNIISTFNFLNTFNLPYDYFNSKRIERIKNITLDEIKIAVKKILNNKSLIKVRVGRIKG